MNNRILFNTKYTNYPPAYSLHPDVDRKQGIKLIIGLFDHCNMFYGAQIELGRSPLTAHECGEGEGD